MPIASICNFYPKSRWSSSSRLCSRWYYTHTVFKEIPLYYWNLTNFLNLWINKRYLFINKRYLFTSHFISWRKYHQSMFSLRSSFFLLFSLKSNLFLHQNNELGVGFQTARSVKTLKCIQVHAQELFETSCCCCCCCCWIEFLNEFKACTCLGFLFLIFFIIL